MGYHPINDAGTADVIIFNTCSVRHHAEEKVISKIAQLRHRRPGRTGAAVDCPDKAQDEPIVAVIGCMAQRLGQQLLDTYEQVDIVCGPSQLHRLGELLGDGGGLALNDPADEDRAEELDRARTTVATETSFMAYLRIMRGCNKYCRYCVVPYVRGPERSRPFNHIRDEAVRLVNAGVKEITLLGQTVNSYHYREDGQSYHLADVLEKLHEIEGLRRLRFVTSYPGDFDRRIFEVMAQLPKVCNYLHLPAQSGSDRILKEMNRRYTAGEYIELIEHARQLVPDIAIAGDFIVGYCGENEQDFEATRSLMIKVRYKNCFIFKYSPRPGTSAERRLEDDVPYEVKKQRNHELLKLQNEISLQDNQRFIGQAVEVLVEGPSKKPHLDRIEGASSDRQLQLVGRTGGDHIVVFQGNRDLIGQLIDVKVTKASALTLFAQLTS